MMMTMTTTMTISILSRELKNEVLVQHALDGVFSFLNYHDADYTYAIFK